jgi:hypothetical protein
VQLDQHVHFLLVDQGLRLEVFGKGLYFNLKGSEFRVAVGKDDLVDQL